MTWDQLLLEKENERLRAEIQRLGEEVEKGHEVALEVMRERDVAQAEVRRLTEELRRLTANNGWQPIATIPRHGEHVLVRTSDESIWLVYAQGGDLWHAHDGAAFGRDDDATHWQPLPLGPEPRTAAGGETP